MKNNHPYFWGFWLFLLAGNLCFSQGPPERENCLCCTSNHQAFDFWVGDWEVTEAGKPAGTNHIVKLQDNCIIQENWVSTAPSYSGTSYNFFNSRTGNWEQLWIDNKGGSLKLEGGLRDGSMVMESQMMTNPKGEKVIHRITWTPNPDGSVRQHWEVRPVHGRGWNTIFDGLYRLKTTTDE